MIAQIVLFIYPVRVINLAYRKKKLLGLKKKLNTQEVYCCLWEERKH